MANPYKASQNYHDEVMKTNIVSAFASPKSLRESGYAIAEEMQSDTAVPMTVIRTEFSLKTDI